MDNPAPVVEGAGTLDDTEAAFQEGLAEVATLAKRFPLGKAPIDAIRGNCLYCTCGDASIVASCELTHCPLWAYRLGVNPFHGGSKG